MQQATTASTTEVRDLDVVSLERRLRADVRGEVRFDAGSRGAYSTDSSNYRQVPIGVVVPLDADDVVATVAACRRFGAPLLSRGGGTSLSGQTTNVAVVVDFSKYMRRVLELDPDRRVARVQPGIVCDELRDAAEEHGLTFGPDPATHNRCTLGGMIGNNACGVHSIMAGRTVDNVESLDVLCYDGTRLTVGPTDEDELDRIVATGGRRGDIYRRLRQLRDRHADAIRQRYPDIPRRVSGYNLDELLPERGFNVARALVGTEGTCVTVLEATCRLVHSPPARSLLVLSYPDVYRAADAVPLVLDHSPIGLEAFDDFILENMERKGVPERTVLPEGGGLLLAEFGGDTPEDAEERARGLMQRLRGADDVPRMKLFDNPGDAAKVWEAREAGLGVIARAPGRNLTWPGWDDTAVAPEKLGDYLRDLRALFGRYGYTGALYGHFGDGCVHVQPDFDLRTADGIRAFRSFTYEAADLVVSYGGSISGEHGDGQARAEVLPKMFGDELVGAFRQFKAIWDPGGKMNPGKVVDAGRLDDDLRLGVDYRPRHPKTHFAFPHDGGSLADASLRCVGVGKCRRTDGGTMCPSYMVTREEEHSTRGRARLLFEMLQGDSPVGGWRDHNVKRALDLCLACKACKSECPVNVDMATYKAEFLSHYYRGRLRPRPAYAMGLIHWWARLGARAPGLANAVAQHPVLGDALKRAGGIAPQRRVPRLAERTFTDWFAGRGAGGGDGGPAVLVWPDTFTNHFDPDVGRAGVEVLEAAGFRVSLPPRPLCCGRPLYDYGMLPTAKRLLRRVLSTLRPQIRAGVPLVGMEPSCVATFRDELVELFPHDEDAQRLSRQSYTLAEFLRSRDDGWRPPRLDRAAVVQAHCHHKSVMGLDAEEALLADAGLDARFLDSGCCGMAGSFGYEADKYDVSVAAGERVLLPAVRGLPDDTLVVADGFSCRGQIEQQADRRALHTAQVLRLALREGRDTSGVGGQ
ncbi:FAD-binding and (Fe-S)-binding domain-containing protein [soil metagenome]